MSEGIEDGIESTHDLLVRLFATQVGLGAPQRAHDQYQLLLSAYPRLKQQALANIEGAVPLPRLCSLVAEECALSSTGGILGIAGKDDALAFAELYRGIELFIGPDTQVDDYAVNAVLTQWVLPLAARKIEAHPILRKVAIRLLNALHGEHPPAVGARNRHALKRTFRFSEAFCAQVH